MKTLDLFRILNVEDIIPFDKDASISIHIGYDDKLYILRQTKVPEPIQNRFARFPNPHADSGYTVYEVDVDWDKGGINQARLITPEHTDCNFSFVRPLGENILMIGARCFYNHDAGKGEDNAFVFDRSGKLLYKMCLGDGISKVLTFPDNRIVTGYFDEGIFGNYGWEEPLGSAGIVVWNQYGHVLWENPDQTIVDVYDLTYGTDGDFWYYAYTDFRLIRISKSYRKTLFETDTEGCYFMIPDPVHDVVLFDGGYDGHERHFMGKILPDGISEKEEIRFLSDNNPVSVSWVERTPNRIIVFDQKANIYTIPS